MLDESLVRRVMRTQLKTVGTLPPEARLAWENHAFNPPAPDAAEPIATQLWVREWQTILSEAKTSTGYIEAVGRTVYGVYTPTGKGTRDADDLSKAIADAFEAGQSLTDTPTVVIIERTSRDGYRPHESVGSWIFKPVAVRWRVFTAVTT